MESKIPSMESKMSMSLSMLVSCRRRSAEAVIFTNVITMGIRAGKLKIAINVALFDALEAMDDTKVKMTEKPRLPNKMAIKKSEKSLTGLSAIKLNSKKVNIANRLTNKLL